MLQAWPGGCGAGGTPWGRGDILVALPAHPCGHLSSCLWPAVRLGCRLRLRQVVCLARQPAGLALCLPFSGPQGCRNVRGPGSLLFYCRDGAAIPGDQRWGRGTAGERVPCGLQEEGRWLPKRSRKPGWALT